MVCTAVTVRWLCGLRKSVFSACPTPNIIKDKVFTIMHWIREVSYKSNSHKFSVFPATHCGTATKLHPMEQLSWAST